MLRHGSNVGFRTSKTSSHLRGENGQMVVELAAVTPVVLMVALVIVNSLFFVAVSARFDHAAPQIVLSVCSSPEGTEFDIEQACGLVTERLSQEIGEERARFEVSNREESGSEVFTCRVFMRPWPLAQGKSSFLGLSIPFELEHEASLALDPYVIGELG